MYFNRIAAVKGQKDDFAIARFGNEAQRCLQMLEDQLATGPFLLGDISVVDVACFAYAASAYWACVDVSKMPKLQELRKLDRRSPPVFYSFALTENHELAPIMVTGRLVGLGTSSDARGWDPEKLEETCLLNDEPFA